VSASNKKVQISPGTRVQLRFVLRLPGGEEIDRTDIEGATFTVGDGSLLPGFERALFGMTAGIRKTIRLEPRDAFGAGSEENVQRFKRTRFGADDDISVGMLYSFADGDRGELAGLVTNVEDGMVTVDFNHPLAGREVLFEVDILEVERVSDEIVRIV
jgi:FKBP-type peptidyl-prolyl cis-trans isomerase SlpA